MRRQAFATAAQCAYLTNVTRSFVVLETVSGFVGKWFAVDLAAPVHRLKLSHAGLVMSTAKAELKALTGVGSSALFGCSAGTRDRGTIDLKKRDRTRTLVALGGSGRPSRCARPTR